MQSGISASKELLSAFQAFVDNPSQRGLLATIDKETLVPGAVLQSSSPDFSSDLSALSTHLTDKAATYIILRRYPSASDGYVAITYVPNSAPVRQKMLFASTRLTLVRELGIERFRETIFCTEAAELTAEGFKKHDQHVNLAAPLTEEEQSLGAVKKAEAEEGRGMTLNKTKLTGLTVGMNMPIDDDAVEALKQLESGSGDNLVQLKLELPGERILLANSSSCDPSTLSSSIASDAPRYSFYRHTAESSNPIIFIYTCPSGSKVKERMVYASSRNYIAKQLTKEIGLTVEKSMEASDPADISAQAIEEEFKPKIEVKKAFDRPKRPGRR